jgi:8-oxo-dGTP pyrophosphatase MutT (NUDIX family)
MSGLGERVAIVEAMRIRKHQANQLIWSAVNFPSNPRPAATVVVLRDGPAGPEVFLVRRHQGTAFMGGAHVFPGGRVDAADHDGGAEWCDGIPQAESQLRDMPQAEAIAYHVAAARELFEEAGVLLARDTSGSFVSLAGAAAHERFKQARSGVHGGTMPLRSLVEREQLRLALDALVLFAHWVTPPIDTRQFDTRFFMTRVPPHQAPAHDDTETTHSAWVRPSDAIGQSLGGEIVLPPPTFTTLRELEPFRSVDEALGWARQRRIVRRMPHLLEEDSQRMLLLPGDPLHPDPPGDELPIETRFVSVDGRWRPERARP